MDAVLTAIGSFILFICAVMFSAVWDYKVIKATTFWQYLFICTWEIGFIVAGFFFGLSLRV